MVRIAGSHPAGPGSIPGTGTQILFAFLSRLLYKLKSPDKKSAFSYFDTYNHYLKASAIKVLSANVI